jgi:flagellar hook-associated protein 3 FlgL
MLSRTNQIQNDRSRAEDIDMVKGISDFQTQQIGYDAALKTYAQVQRLSLFNYMS